MADKCEYEPVDTGNGKKKIEKMEEEQVVGLKASLGLIQGCTIIVGSIIGSGIFIAPGGVLKQTGSVMMSLTIWVLSGLYSMIGAYCYAELGLLIRKVSTLKNECNQCNVLILDRKSTRLNSSHSQQSRMPSSA